MIIDKDLLMNYGKFLFRSGEESFNHMGHIELNKNIEQYIEETFKNFIENAKKEKEAQNE